MRKGENKIGRIITKVEKQSNNFDMAIFDGFDEGSDTSVICIIDEIRTKCTDYALQTIAKGCKIK